jgi:pimeloyl-ACP methyl ester carboxylesterase
MTGENPEAQPPSRYTYLGDLSIHYTAGGSGRPALFFVHGWSCDSTFWRFQTDYFRKSQRVIAIDLPGHGKSKAPKIEYTFDLFTSAINRVMIAEGLDRAVLVGHSMGFPVTRLFAKKFPDKTLGLCIVDGAYFRVPDDPAKLANWKARSEEFARGFSGRERQAYTRQFLTSMYVKQTPEWLKDEVSRKVLRTPERVAASAMGQMVKPESWQDYPLPVPALAVYAMSDDMPADNEKYLRTLFPSLEYHLWNDSGHFLMMEQPDRFNAVLAAFLKKRFPKGG